MRNVIRSKWVPVILAVTAAGVLVSAAQQQPNIQVQFLTYDSTSFPGDAGNAKKEIAGLLQRGFDLHAVVHTGVEPAGQLLVFCKK